MISALSDVADTMLCIGDSPSETRSANSRALSPCLITAASVAKPMGRPAASARRKPAFWTCVMRRDRSNSLAGMLIATPSSSIDTDVYSVGT